MQMKWPINMPMYIVVTVFTLSVVLEKYSTKICLCHQKELVQNNSVHSLLEEITKWIDVGSPVDIIYLDFQKAFDKVPHQRLLLKLKAHGIGDSITDWIEQWLTDRRQRVVVDGEVSN